MKTISSIKLLAQLLIFCIPATTQGAPIILQAGDRAVFQFDFSPIDISSVDTIRYEWFTQAIPSIPSTDGVPIFEWRYRIFDELGEEPAFIRPSNLLSGTFRHFIDNHFTRQPFFDDPVSYIELDFQGVRVLNADGFSELADSKASMEISASVFVGSTESTPIAQVAGVGTLPSPSVLALFAVALFSLGWSLRHGVRHSYGDSLLIDSVSARACNASACARSVTRNGRVGWTRSSPLASKSCARTGMDPKEISKLSRYFR